MLYCCQANIGNSDTDELIDTQRNGIDWGYFLKKARTEGISPLIYHRLQKVVISKNNIPKDVIEELKKDYYLSATKNTLIFKELGKLLEACNKVGLQVIVLKGAALAETVYENLALRPMSDIDLLVRKEDLLSLDKQLKTLGYWPSDRSVDDIDLYSPSYLTTLDYRNSSNNSPSFHIHWHFVNSTIPNDSYIKDIPIENIWRDAEKTRIAQVETQVMVPHHLIIHLSEHALRVTHSLSKFCFFCDINEAIAFYQERLDWDKLLRESDKFNLSRMVYLSLYFAGKFLATRIPHDVLLKLRPKRFTLGEKLFINSISNNDRSPGLSYLVHLSMNKGLFRKMRFVWRTLFPPRQIIAQRSYIPQSRVSPMNYLRRIKEVFSHFFKMVIILGKNFRRKPWKTCNSSCSLSFRAQREIFPRPEVNKDSSLRSETFIFDRG